MTTTSKYTKATKARLWVYRILDILILICPLAITIGFAYANGQAPTHQKVALTGCIAIALILTIFNILTKRHLRSPIWIIVIGLYCAMENILPLIIVLACSTVVDEFILTPLITHYKTKLVADKAMDRRGL